MSEVARGSFAVTAWEETVLQDYGDGGRLVRVEAQLSYEGGLQGPALAEYLMVYRDDGGSEFHGYQRVQADLDGRQGDLVLEVHARFDGRVTEGELAAITGSGDPVMREVKGAGSFFAELGPTGDYEFDYVWLDPAVSRTSVSAPKKPAG